MRRKWLTRYCKDRSCSFIPSKTEGSRSLDDFIRLLAPSRGKGKVGFPLGKGIIFNLIVIIFERFLLLQETPMNWRSRTLR